jgi:hypothetical protein
MRWNPMSNYSPRPPKANPGSPISIGNPHLQGFPYIDGRLGYTPTMQDDASTLGFIPGALNGRGNNHNRKADFLPAKEDS